MALDDFLGDSTEPQSVNDEKEPPKENKKKFTRYNRQEFEDVLDETGLEFEEQDYEWAQELIYEAKSKQGRFSVRVYSSIDKRTDKARDKGSDAIRVVVIDNDTERPVMKDKRVNRITTWPENLKKRIKKVQDSKGQLKTCKKCGSIMVVRYSKKNDSKFWGCSGYPDCKNTRPLN